MAKTKTAAKTAAPAAKSAAKPATKSAPKSISKKELLRAVHEAIGDALTLKQVSLVVEALGSVGQAELKKTGILVVPGFAKFVVVAKAAKPAHEGINPFTQQKQMFAAKPASKSVKARPVKAIKDAVV